MKYLLLLSLLIISIFAFSPGQFTPAYIVNHDKLAHMVALFALSFLVQGAFPSVALRYRVLALGAIALMIEVVQYVFVGRGFSLEDLLYDVIGIVLFVMTGLIFRLFQKVLCKQPNRSYDGVKK